MRPHLTIHMMSSVDGRIDLGRWTKSPDGDEQNWQALYSAFVEKHGADGFLLGRTTVAEMMPGEPHPPKEFVKPDRPLHFATPEASNYAIAVDRSGKLHFNPENLGSDPVLVLLGPDVPDSHLAELAADGISYIVSETPGFDIRRMLEILYERGMKRLLSLGGGALNGSLVAAGLVDEINVLVIPSIDGRRSAGLFDMDELPASIQISLVSVERLDHGVAQLRYAVLNQGNDRS